MIRVMILEQQPILRQGLIRTLEQGHCEIVAAPIDPTDTAEIVETARRSNPDIVLLDIAFSPFEILEIAQHMKTSIPKAAIIILTAQEEEEWLFQAIKAGAAAYYNRNMTPDELREAVQKVSMGEYLINDEVFRSNPQLASRVLRSFREQVVEDDITHDEQPSPLSSREIEILDHIAQGNSNKEIAKVLKISDQTVKNHITSILKKLSVNDRTAAVVHALKNGWIRMGEQ